METAVDSAVGFLLEKLLQLVKDNYDLISGAESKVAKLSKSLRLLKTFATEYTEKHPNNKILKELAEEIKDLIREAEDAIEEYIYVSVQKSKGLFKRVVHAVDDKIKVREVSKKIGDVSCKVMEMYEKNSQIGKDALRLEDSAKGSAIGNNCKANVWEMTQLRHLHANTSTILPVCEQPSTGATLQIQTISAISPESCTREVFKRTPKLKKLGIHGKLNTLVQANGGESNLFDGLLDLQFLENLKLVNDDVNLFKLHVLEFPEKLTKLSLQNTNLDWTTEMSTLRKLPNLAILKLKDNAFKGRHWQTEDGGFRRLEVLSIGATDLEDWKADASNFPVLKCLVLKHCGELKVIPAGFADIKTLKMIDLECTNSSVVSSARKIKDTKTSEIKLKVYPPE